MAQLIHVNGPSGVGKSTVAQRYADRHPGVLNLDTDQVVSLIGGWRENFWQALTAGRRLAIGMAETHAERHRHIEEIVARGGGPALLVRIHDQLTAYVRGRPECVVVMTDGRGVDQTYDDVIAVLGRC
ncbi:AAA family ATPase [Kutzneria sp. NPDC051319]|uniref:AAA family ATPase n=1 Tax=Kutzneria sp. NPDC051319 TaxID=3155047 RepID=UPI003441CF13